MNTSPNATALCETAKEIFTSPYYRGILIAELVFSALAIAPNALLLSVVWRVIVLPSNLRLLLGHMSFIFLWFSIGDITKIFYYLFLTSPCAYNISIRNCRIFDLATTWLILPNIYYSLMPLCVERVYASINYRVYDIAASNKKPWMALFLILCAWLTAGLINGNTLFTLPTDRYVPICDGSCMPPTSNSMLTFSTYLILEGVAGMAVAFIYYYNRHVARSMAINRAKYSLSARFQIDQNVQVNAIIIPSMILHFIYHLPSFTATVVLQTSVAYSVSVETKACLGRLTVWWRLVYAVTHPILAFYCNAHLKHHLIRGPVGKIFEYVGIEGCNAKQASGRTTISNAAAHFDYLHQLWSTAKVPPKKTPLVAPKLW